MKNYWWHINTSLAHLQSIYGVSFCMSGKNVCVGATHRGTRVTATAAVAAAVVACNRTVWASLVCVHICLCIWFIETASSNRISHFICVHCVWSPLDDGAFHSSRHSPDSLLRSVLRVLLNRIAVVEGKKCVFLFFSFLHETNRQESTYGHDIDISVLLPWKTGPVNESLRQREIILYWNSTLGRMTEPLLPCWHPNKQILYIR